MNERGFDPASAAGVFPGTPEWLVLDLLCEMGGYAEPGGDVLYNDDWYEFCKRVVRLLDEGSSAPSTSKDTEHE